MLLEHIQASRRRRCTCTDSLNCIIFLYNSIHRDTQVIKWWILFLVLPFFFFFFLCHDIHKHSSSSSHFAFALSAYLDYERTYVVTSSIKIVSSVEWMWLWWEENSMRIVQFYGKKTFSIRRIFLEKSIHFYPI